MSQSAAPPGTKLFRDLWKKQDGICALCGTAMPRHRFEMPHSTVWKKRRPSFDHIIPRAKGGADAADNLQLAHANCNRRKGANLGESRLRSCAS